MFAHVHLNSLSTLSELGRINYKQLNTICFNLKSKKAKKRNEIGPNNVATATWSDCKQTARIRKEKERKVGGE